MLTLLALYILLGLFPWCFLMVHEVIAYRSFGKVFWWVGLFHFFTWWITFFGLGAFYTSKTIQSLILGSRERLVNKVTKTP